MMAPDASRGNDADSGSQPGAAGVAAQPAAPAYWFAAKTYGWGWGLPLTWQGWVVFAAYIAAVSVVSVLWPPPRHALGFGAGIAGATLAMLAVCWLKGEPPRWRWGK